MASEGSTAQQGSREFGPRARRAGAGASPASRDAEQRAWLGRDSHGRTGEGVEAAERAEGIARDHGEGGARRSGAEQRPAL
jgi:hypothetical protein